MGIFDGFIKPKIDMVIALLGTVGPTYNGHTYIMPWNDNKDESLPERRSCLPYSPPL